MGWGKSWSAPVFVLGTVLAPMVVAMRVEAQADRTSTHPHAEIREENRPEAQTIVRAVRVTSIVQLDGLLSEAAWEAAAPAGAFVQRDPDVGEPASERTEVRVLFDDEALYLGVRLFDSRPDAITARDRRRDFEPARGDHFAVVLDTFGDGQDGFIFLTNPAGAQADLQSSGDGAELNPDWNGVWRVATQRDSAGWTAEFLIPFRTLRFDPQRSGAWRINFARYLARRAETSFWRPVPPQYDLARVSLAGELTGLVPGRPGRNLQIKPSVVSGLHTIGGSDFSLKSPSLSADVKYSITPALTLSVMANPDFSHVETDEQQIHLDRFPLMLPEKRDFFLENAGIFEVIPSGYRGDLRPFFSRRIGLSPKGRPISVTGGARIAGRLRSSTGVGMMYARTSPLEDDSLTGEDVPGSDFLVVRIREELPDGAALGGILAARGDGGGWRGLAGVDGEVRFGSYGYLLGYWLASRTPDLKGRDHARYIQGGWRSPTWRLTTSVTDLQENFRADVGFLPRPAVQRYYLSVERTYRPEAGFGVGVRRISPQVRTNILVKPSGELQTKQAGFGVQTLFSNAVSLGLTLVDRRDIVENPFKLVSGLTVPAGDHAYRYVEMDLRSNPARRLSTAIRVTRGGFWNGTRAGAMVEGAWSVREQLRIGGTYRREQLELPDGSRTLNLLGGRIAFAASARVFLDAFAQYNPGSDEWMASLRLNMIHRPFSHLYVTLEERRNTRAGEVRARHLTVKFSQLVAL